MIIATQDKSAHITCMTTHVPQHPGRNVKPEEQNIF